MAQWAVNDLAETWQLCLKTTLEALKLQPSSGFAINGKSRAARSLVEVFMTHYVVYACVQSLHCRFVAGSEARFIPVAHQQNERTVTL